MNRSLLLKIPIIFSPRSYSLSYFMFSFCERRMRFPNSYCVLILFAARGGAGEFGLNTLFWPFWGSKQY